MGYDLHITRAEFWANAAGHEITLDEWRRYVASDPQVQQDADNGPEDFLFVAHPKGPAPLWWARGQIYSKYPDRATVQKMIEIARKLGARVQGDDGETYEDASAIEE